MDDDGAHGGGSGGGRPRESQRVGAGAPAAAASSGGAAEAPQGLLPSLSLPKGGGAIRGIGEKFQANVATGTGSLSVPIATSPGRGGFDVALSLGYDSGAGNGPFGVGWGLSVPQVTRKTDKGLPRYDDGTESDLFILSGAEDLVPKRVPSGAGTRLDFDDRTEGPTPYRVQRYRPRVEGLFARIERWTNRDTGDVHWRATTKDNVTSIYGKDPQARIADPEAPRRVFSWLLQETRDDRGNIARYLYKAEDGAGVAASLVSEQNRFEVASNGARAFRAKAQRYLKRVEYGNHKPDDDSAFHFQVVFDYGEHDIQRPRPQEGQPWSVRVDPFSSHRAGFEVRTYRLCRRVLMFHRFPELGAAPQLVRSTDFGYRETPVLTYLETVTHAGYKPDGQGGYSRMELPRLECGYILPEIHDKLESLDRDSLEGIPAGVAGQSQWVDLDGEGLPGVLTATAGAWFYKENLGGGSFGPPRRQQTLPAPAELASGTQQLTDLADDGKLDLVQYSPPLAGYFERVSPRGTDPGDWRPFVPLRELPNIDWSDPNLRFVDLDGDGHPDVLITEHEAFVWYRSRAKDGFEPAARTRKPLDENRGPALVFADGTETIHLADMSGDGLSDLVRVRSGEVCYWPNRGYGRFGRKVTMGQGPRFDAPDQFDPRRIRFADIDGSGTTDLVYLGRREVTVHLNQSGNSFSEAVPIRSVPPTDTIANVTVVDLFGRGTACLLWSSALPAARNRPVAYVDLMGGRKPHLLDRIDNNLGGETRIRYAASTQFYLEDKKAGAPWLTRLPFPVQVIERIETYDHIAKSRLVTSYRYRHGFFDGHEREFRGFAFVETLDAESFSGDKGAGLFPASLDATPDELRLPPVLTKTWFHTGAWLERERLETELAKEYYASDPQAPPLFRDTILPQGLSVREEREAARALRGQTLRQEVYALDDTPESVHPYTVSEQNYETRLVQRAEAEGNAVLFVHPRETLTLHYERQPADPRIQQELMLEVDDFGNVTQSAAIAYPRRQPLEPEQGKMWALLSEATFANEPSQQGSYRLGVPVETATSELTGLPLPPSGLLSLGDVRNAVAATTEIPYETAGTGNIVEQRTVERQRIFYYRDDLSAALPLGQIGERALPHETKTVAFTPGLLTQAYGNRIDGVVLQNEGRYINEDGLWWAPSGRVVYDPACFFQPARAIDPFGNQSILRYDQHCLLVLETEDAVGNRVTSGERDLTVAGEPIKTEGNDYRVLAPRIVSDANCNRTGVEFDELGMVVKTAVMGKEGAGVGDTLAEPTVEITYDLLRYQNSKGGPKPLPSFVKTKAKEEHGPQNTKFQVSLSYSDGSGREAMTKVQAEPGDALVRDASTGAFVPTPVDPRWVGTGRTVFDNKGNPFKQYEPFFSATSEYEDEAELVESGVTPILRYDPLGRLIRTNNPDGTHVKVEFDAWEQRSFDENDTVFGTRWLAERQTGTPAEQRAATQSLKHQATPTAAHFDALGRPFLTIDDDGSRKLETRVALDIEGNTLSVTDARGIVTLQQTFDVLGRAVFSTSPDAGELRMFPDVANKPARSFTARGHVVRHNYDELQRPTHMFVRAPGPGGGEELVQRTVYGEEHAQARDLNQRGEAHLVYDGAGVVKSVEFDFKGNLIRSERKLATEYKETPDWAPLDALTDPAAVEAAAAAKLEAETFASAAAFDALDRVTSQTTPDGSITLPTYNEAGLLETLSVRIRGAQAETTFVADIDYNARGQRLKVEHGNGTVCEYSYDDQTFRLAHQNLERSSDNQVLQDLAYTYDAAGNIVQITDGVSFATVQNLGNPGLVRGDGLYEYDSIYQLRKAEGREHPGQQPTHADPMRLRVDHPNDMQALQRYGEEYSFDEVGNILEMKHRPLQGPGGWTRRYDYAATSNRLLGTSVPGDAPGLFSAKYMHDAGGNMVTISHLPLMAWDYANRLQATAQQVVNSGTPETTYYTYDAAGERVRKVTEHEAQAGQAPRKKQERIYVGSERFREYEADGTTVKLERETLHVMDDEHRVALVETKTVDTSAPAAAFQVTSRQRYQVSNHLDSSSMELDETAQVISYEEYFPFGGTSLHAAHSATEVSAKGYRYTGKERDDETGLNYHGARYYAAWLGRWTSADPAGFVDGTNVFAMVANQPLSMSDPSGMGGRRPTILQRIRNSRLARALVRTVEAGISATGVHDIESPPFEELYQKNNPRPADDRPRQEGSGAPPNKESARPPGPDKGGGAPGQQPQRRRSSKRGARRFADKMDEIFRWARRGSPGTVASSRTPLANAERESRKHARDLARSLGGRFNNQRGFVSIRGVTFISIAMTGTVVLLSERRAEAAKAALKGLAVDAAYGAAFLKLTKSASLAGVLTMVVQLESDNAHFNEWRARQRMIAEFIASKYPDVVRRHRYSYVLPGLGWKIGEDHTDEILNQSEYDDIYNRVKYLVEHPTIESR